MQKLVYVTKNKGKYIAVLSHARDLDVEIEFLSHEFLEPDVNDLEYISKKKAEEAYKITKSPCFVCDSGFYINNYPGCFGYPGAFVKRSGISTNIKNLLQIMTKVEDRSCYFVDVLTFYDGKNFYQFYGVSEGILAKSIKGNTKKEAKSNLWQVFIPKNHKHTLAEMSEEEFLNRKDFHTSATLEFLNWYKFVYLKKVL